MESIFVRIEYYISKRKTNEIIVSDFQSLIDHIADFWQNEANLDIYPRKMATWLGEYLEWLGYPNFDYHYVLNAIYNQIDRADEQALLSKIFEIKDPDVKARIRKIDMDLPAKNRGEFLGKKIDEFVEEVPKTLKSSIFYFDQNYKMHTIEMESEVAQIEDKETEYTSIIAFENPLEITIKDVMINNIVPYDYKVKNYDTVGLRDIRPTKKLLDDGLQLTWIIPQLGQKQEAKIELNLERRISRTILMNIGEDVSILNTYFNIIPEVDKYFASDVFSNVQELIENLIIEDQIPKTFNLIDVRPDDPHDVNLLKIEDDQLVKWQYELLEMGINLKHTYTLLDRRFFILNRFVVKAEMEDEPLLEIAKIIEPNIQFYELLVSFYLKFNEKIKEFYIKEAIPNNLNTTTLIPNTIEKSIEIIDDKIMQVWKLVPETTKNTLQFGYICSGESLINEFPIELFIPEMKINLKEEITTEMEKKTFFLPELHSYLQENKRKKTSVG